MKTEVIMKRNLFGEEISQKSKSEFFSATDLVSAGNKWRISQGMSVFKMPSYLQSDKTKEFISELEKEFGEQVPVIMIDNKIHDYWKVDLERFTNAIKS